MQNRRNTIKRISAITAGLLIAPKISQAQSTTENEQNFQAHTQTNIANNPLLAPNPEEYKKHWDNFLQGKTPQEEGIEITASALADNPSTVPVKLKITKQINEKNWCEELILLGELNPSPLILKIQFSPLTGSAEAAIRIRLSQSQNIHALAKMSSGEILHASTHITVSGSGCGM